MSAANESLSRVLDAAVFRSCLSRFATGVTIVTAQAPDGPYGLTANAFTAVSLDPPLVLVSISKRARSHELLDGRPFSVNVLSAEQERLARHFAGDRQPDLTIRWRAGQVSPCLERALACFECKPWRAYDGGDHTLYLGEVVALDYAEGDALAFFRSRFVRLGQAALSPDAFRYDPFELPYDAYE